MTARVFMF